MRSISSKLLAFVGAIAFATVAHGQATRTFVSGVGDDANPCSRTAPCKTFAGAISKTAAGGEINVIDPGGFGAVTVTKSITIDGNGALASILNSGTNGVVINATGANDIVILRNLEINGATTGLRGISVIAVKKLIVDNVNIYGQLGTGANGQGINILTSTNGMNVAVRHCRIENNASQGISANTSGAGAISISVEDTAIENNALSGIEINNNVKLAVNRANISYNGAGIRLDAAANTADVANSWITFNTIGIIATAANARLFATQLTNNFVSLQTASGGVVQTHGNNAVQNNNTNTLPTPNLNTQ